jgi:hypothetical protein
MILAHTRSWGMTSDFGWLSTGAWKLGFFAPALFFCGVGASVVYQADRYTRTLITASYAGLMLFSFAWEGMREYESNYLHVTSNLLFALGLAGILCLPFIRMLRAPGLRLRVIPLVVLPLLVLGGVVLIARTALADAEHISSGLVGQAAYFLPGICAALLGAYVLGRTKRMVLFGALTTATLCASVAAGQSLTTQDGTSSLYVSAGMALCCATLLLAPRLIYLGWFSRALVYLGRNSLLFFFVHYAVIVVSPALPFAPLAWVACFGITLGLMLLLSWANRLVLRSRIAVHPLFWLLLLVVEATPALLPLPSVAQRILMCGVGTVFALNHSQFRLCVALFLRPRVSF